jgi:hypothetical protein
MNTIVEIIAILGSALTALLGLLPPEISSFVTDISQETPAAVVEEQSSVATDTAPTATTTTTEAPEQPAAPVVTQEQAAVLETFGLEVSELPSLFTPELEQCATDALGEDRVAEIKAGAVPTAGDLLQTRGCL